MNTAIQSPDAQVVDHEEYIHDYHSAHATKMVQQRRAATHAAFLLPYLHPGMDLLDCGCGPGTVTVGLASAIAPGLTVGVDIAQDQIEQARINAVREGSTNIRFDVEDLYALPYADNNFDAAYMQAVVGHLHNPMEALKEVWRVLKPGGVIGVRDSDFGGFLIAPTDPLIDNAFELYIRFRQDNGGDPYNGRRLREYVRRAGFVNTRASGAYECWGTEEETGYIVDVLLAELAGPRVTEHAVTHGWADREHFQQIAAALKRWGSHPDAFWGHSWCEAIGWKETP